MTPRENESEPAALNLEPYRVRAARALSDIQPPPGEWDSIQWEGHSLSLEDFPVPDLVRFALTRLCGLKEDGPGEKVAWSIDAQFQGVPFQLALRKFGFQFVIRKGTPEAQKEQFVACLRKAAALAAASLKNTAAEQIERGQISIDNQYRVFEGAYRFFRKEAADRFASSPSCFAAFFVPKAAEAGYFAGAMVSAYFSRLEHVLVLALPFTDFEPGNGALKAFASGYFEDKLKRLFDLENDAPAKRLRETLAGIKKQFRNPLAHGGFDKQGTLFHFHVPDLAAIPALLTRHDISVERHVRRISRPEFETLCRQLDECDEWLEQSAIGPGVRFAAMCLPISFDKRFRKKCRAAAQSPEALEAFTDAQVEMFDRHVNMDY